MTVSCGGYLISIAYCHFFHCILTICYFSYFPFCFEGCIWVLIASFLVNAYFFSNHKLRYRLRMTLAVGSTTQQQHKMYKCSLELPNSGSSSTHNGQRKIMYIHQQPPVLLYLRPKVTLHFSVQNISTLILILSKLNIARSSQYIP